MAKRILSYLSMKFYCHVHWVPLTSKNARGNRVLVRKNSFKKDLMYFSVLSVLE